MDQCLHHDLYSLHPNTIRPVNLKAIYILQHLNRDNFYGGISGKGLEVVFQETSGTNDLYQNKFSHSTFALFY